MKKIYGALLALIGLTGCSSYSLVNSSVYNNADLADFHTFRIVSPADGDMPPGMSTVTYYNIAAAIREQLVERGYTEDPNSPILVNIGVTVKKEVAYQTITQPGIWVPVGGPGPQPGPSPDPSPQRPQGLQLNHGGGPGLQMPPQGSGLHFDRPLPGPPHNGVVPYFMYPRSYYIPGPTQIVPSIYREGVLTMDIVDLSTNMPLYSSSVATILDNGDTQFRNLSGIAQAVKVLFSKFPVKILPQYK